MSLRPLRSLVWLVVAAVLAAGVALPLCACDACSAHAEETAATAGCGSCSDGANDAETRVSDSPCPCEHGLSSPDPRVVERPHAPRPVPTLVVTVDAPAAAHGSTSTGPLAVRPRALPPDPERLHLLHASFLL